MMKFDRIYRNANDTVVYVVMVDIFDKRVELWQWPAKPVDGLVSKPVLVKEHNYDDYTERVATVRRFHDAAKQLSKI